MSRLDELRNWVRTVASGRLIAVLPCYEGSAGKADTVCAGGSMWRRLRTFIEQSPAFSGHIYLDAVAGVLLPDDEVKGREWRKKPTKSGAGLIRKELKDEQFHDASFVTFLPDRLGDLRALLNKRTVFHAFEGLDEAEQKAFVNRLLGVILRRQTKQEPTAPPPGMLVIPGAPKVAGNDRVPVLYIVTETRGNEAGIAPWPRTVWPALSQWVRATELVPLPMTRPAVTDEELAAAYEERQVTLKRQAAEETYEPRAKDLERKAKIDLEAAIKQRREEGPQQPFGINDIQAAQAMREREWPIDGVRPSAYLATAASIAKGQEVPKVVFVGAVSSADPELREQAEQAWS